MKFPTLSLVFLMALSVCGFAQDEPSSPGVVQSTEDSSIRVPAIENPAGLTVIYSNLGSSTNAYNGIIGFQVAGPASNVGHWFDAFPFVPKSNAHVSQISIPIQYTSGANRVNVSLHSNAGGVPGAILSGPHVFKNLPASETCCYLPTWTLPTSVEVKAGVKYWIVADTPLSGAGADFIGIWCFIASPAYPVAFNFGNTSDWQLFTAGTDELAVGVYGTIP